MKYTDTVDKMNIAVKQKEDGAGITRDMIIAVCATVANNILTDKDEEVQDANNQAWELKCELERVKADFIEYVRNKTYIHLLGARITDIDRERLLNEKMDRFIKEHNL